MLLRLPIEYHELTRAIVIYMYGLGAGGAWIAAIASPNTSYDKLDPARADTHIRALLRTASAQIAVVLLLAAGLAALIAYYMSALFAVIAAVGFISNRLILSRRSTEGRVRDRRQARRVIAVGLTLVFMLAILIAMIFAVQRL